MMTRVRFSSFIIGIFFLTATGLTIRAQEPATATTAPSEQTEEQKSREAAEKKAIDLLEQIVAEVQTLKLPENRIRVEIAAAGMLWKRNETRARSLFTAAADGVAELNRSPEINTQRRAPQLRQELVLTAVQHDAALAYQILATTRPLTPPSEVADNFRRPNADFNLEDNLLARVAAVDPKLAAQKVEEELAKGQYPTTLAQVLIRLQAQDKDAGAKLTTKVVSKLQSENMLANAQAQSLALNLLRSGPMPAATTTTATTDPAVSNQIRFGSAVLGESAYQSLLSSVVDAAMKATPQTPSNQTANNQRGQNNFRGRGQRNANQTPLTEGQLEQQNARRLLGGLQMVLPQIDQYLPARATAVRTKMTELGMGGNQANLRGQLNGLMRQGTADSIIAAAADAPPGLQTRLYQQAAQRAIEEGDEERARQIANDHLDATARDRVLQRVDFMSIAKKAEADNLDELRATLATLGSDDERIDLLTQLAAQVQLATPNQKPAVATPANPKLALQFLTEAQRLATRRATNYQQFDQQLRVADALSSLDAARSFDLLDPGIAQLNELLAAAALLSGFEVSIFRDGELPFEGGSGLGNMVARYGQVLATLAKSDFARAESSANKFYLAEPRLVTKLAIVRNILGVPRAQLFNNDGGRGRRRAQ